MFTLLTDPGVIASGLPAARGHRVLDDSHWEVKVKPPVPLAPSITVRFELLEQQPGRHAALRAHGGGADITSRFDLSSDGDGTRMRWQADLRLAGPVGRLVGPGLDVVAARQAARTLDAVERSL